MIRIYCDVCGDEIRNGNEMPIASGVYYFEGSAAIKNKTISFRVECRVDGEGLQHLCRNCVELAIGERRTAPLTITTTEKVIE